jgi:hypothetical protein
MKGFSSFVVSLGIAAVCGFMVGGLILWAMAGYPNRTGGGSWDLGPVLYPIFALPGLVLTHAVAFAIFSSSKFTEKRWMLSAFVGSLGYAGIIAGIALSGGYKG